MRNYVKRYYDSLYKAISNITSFAYGKNALNLGQVSIENPDLEEITYDGKLGGIEKIALQSKRGNKRAKKHSYLDKEVGIEICGGRMSFLSR